MRPPAKCSSMKGLLLVEAVLSAVIIATGLIFVTRGLSTPLRALRTIDEQGLVRSLAQRKLLELETTRLLERPMAKDRHGAFATPYTAYQWTVAAKAYEAVEPQASNRSLSEVTVAVQRIGEPSASARLSAVWQSEWVPDGWL